jgi:hypothetical protein
VTISDGEFGGRTVVCTYLLVALAVRFGDLVASGAQVLFKDRVEKQFLSYIVPGHFLDKSLATALLVIMVLGTSDIVIALLDVAVVPGDGV